VTQVFVVLYVYLTELKNIHVPIRHIIGLDLDFLVVMDGVLSRLKGFFSLCSDYIQGQLLVGSIRLKFI
jgi:hypothetical protein